MRKLTLLTAALHHSGVTRPAFAAAAAVAATAAAKPSAVATLHATRFSSSAPHTANASRAAAAAAASDVGAAAAPASPLRRVGNIFIVHCVDHPFKYSWEVNRTLHELRLEYMGQTTIVPDTPDMRKRLWRVRHIVRLDMLDLDEAKALIGVPQHMTFTDLNKAIPGHFGRGPAAASPHLRSRRNFMRLRRMHLRDVLHRDAVEKRLLEERRALLATKQQGGEAATTNGQ